MSEIPKYLKDNPDFYIDWGDIIMNNVDSVNQEIQNILTFNDEKQIQNHNWPRIFEISSNWLDVWYISYLDDNKSWFIVGSGINNWNYSLFYDFNNNKDFRWQWYWKILYILAGIEALNNKKTLYSDTKNSISEEARYIWNSLVNLWLVEFDENTNRFKFISNMLEDHFPDKIKNTD